VFGGESGLLLGGNGGLLLLSSLSVLLPVGFNREAMWSTLG
jgi:hypothetical protein